MEKSKMNGAPRKILEAAIVQKVWYDWSLRSNDARYDSSLRRGRSTASSEEVPGE